MGKRKAVTKKSVTLRLDPDVIEFYKSKAASKSLGYQTGINMALKELMYILQNDLMVLPKIELLPEQLEKARLGLDEINAKIRSKKSDSAA